MPIYNVKVWYTTYTISEVEASEPESALEQVILGDPDKEQVLTNLEAMEFNDEVTLADSQYTDQQELRDREKDL